MYQQKERNQYSRRDFLGKSAVAFGGMVLGADYLPRLESEELVSSYRPEFFRQIGNTIVGVVSAADGKKYAVRSDIDENGDITFKNSGELSLQSSISGAAVAELNPNIVVVTGGLGELWYTIDGGKTSKKITDPGYGFYSVDLAPDGTEAYVSRTNDGVSTSFGKFDIASNSFIVLNNQVALSGKVETKTPLRSGQIADSLYNFGTIQYGTGIVRTDFFPDNTFSLQRFGRDIPVDFFRSGIHSYVDKNGKNIIWGFDSNAISSTGRDLSKMYVFTDNVNTSVAAPKEALFPPNGAITMGVGVSNLEENKGYWGVNFQKSGYAPYVVEFQLDNPDNQTLITRNGLPPTDILYNILLVPINGQSRLALNIQKGSATGQEGIWLLNKTRDLWEFQDMHLPRRLYLPSIRTK